MGDLEHGERNFTHSPHDLELAVDVDHSKSHQWHDLEANSEQSDEAAVSGYQSEVNDTVLLQIARRYDELAHDPDFNRCNPLTGAIIRELVGAIPMRQTTPEILSLLRDILGQEQGQFTI